MMKISAKLLLISPGNLIKNGYLEIDDNGTIQEKGILAEGEEPDYDGVLVPGFVNSHCHIELSHLKGLFTKGSGMDGFIQQINALRTNVKREERIAALTHEMDNLYHQGVSAMADISNCNESFAAKAASKLYTRTFLEVFGTEPKDVPAIMEDVLSLQREAMGYGLDAAPTPHSCYTMSQELNRRVAAEGLKNGYISYHSEESREENDMVRYGTGALADDYNSRGTTTLPVFGVSSLIYFIENLKKAITLPIDANVLLVHNVDTSSESIQAAKKAFRRSFWVLCPLSNIFIHNALPPVNLLRENGLTICIGTDSLSSNDQLCMVDELRCIQENYPEIPLSELLTWATYNGAVAIGKDSIYGSFDIGKRPGVVLIENIVDGKLTKESISRRLI
ncbi:MAG: amidohydrolase family protein [Bacteroidales bacterium]|nr:amidohydrolase family protein [Bacteroidales bacterium]